MAFRVVWAPEVDSHSIEQEIRGIDKVVCGGRM